MDSRIQIARSVLRLRWLHLLVLFGGLLILDPHPIFDPLVLSLERAGVALEADRPGAAAQALEAALRLEPELGQVRALAAKAALQADDPDRALQLLEGAADSVGAPCLRFQAAFAQAGPREAADQLKAAPAGCRPDPDRLAGLAEAALLAEDPALAESLQRALLQIRPDDPSALTDLAIMVALQDPGEALPLLHQIMELPGQSPPLARDLLRAIEDALLEEFDAYHFAQVGQTLTRHHLWPQARLAFERALALDPDYTEARAFYGLVASRAGGTGLRHLQRAYQEAPGAAVPASLLAMYWLEAGRPEQALPYAQEAASREPSNPAYAAQLGAVLAATGDVQSAQASYEKAAELLPNDARFWNLLAEFSLRYEIDIVGLAIPAARRGYLLERTARSADNLGYAHLLAGNLEVARRLLDCSLALDPGRAETLYHRGLLSLERGQTGRAQELLNRAGRLDPEGVIGDLAERTLDRISP